MKFITRGLGLEPKSPGDGGIGALLKQQQADADRTINEMRLARASQDAFIETQKGQIKLQNDATTKLLADQAVAQQKITDAQKITDEQNAASEALKKQTNPDPLGLRGRAGRSLFSSDWGGFSRSGLSI